MKIRVVSDLHFEFHADHGLGLACAVTAGDYDVLVIAGDLSNSALLRVSLTAILDRAKKPVVYVHGNHEFYGSNRRAVVLVTQSFEKDYSNFFFLDGESALIDGVRFLGTPLWFRKTSAPKWAMNDFSAIEKFESWVYEENGNARKFLEDELEFGDVVVTHYLPTERSIHADFKGNILNPFFLCDMKPLIEKREPRLWIHGHTHRSCFYEVGRTRVVCNPFGYAAHEENSAFDPTFTVEVLP